MTRPILLSGIQPSGNLTLGNYLGAIQQWQSLKKDFTSLFLVVDLHALTNAPQAEQLQTAILDTFALYLACGFDPQEDTLFLQSQVSAHCELNWYLNCFTYFGELQRMTQFKEKSQKKRQTGANTGLFTYPCLMAADILLYQTKVVPVGEDQTQHLELTRTVAQRFNQLTKKSIFTIPERISPPVAARVMSLTTPTQKMSKSDPDPKGRIELLDDFEEISKKINAAQTDSLHCIRYDRASQPGISNLIEIYAALTGRSTAVVLDEVQDWNYSRLKRSLIEVLYQTLGPIQKAFKEYRQDPAQLRRLMALGAERASKRAEPTLASVRQALGLHI